jgi:hypothetical protein
LDRLAARAAENPPRIGDGFANLFAEENPLFFPQFPVFDENAQSGYEADLSRTENSLQGIFSEEDPFPLPQLPSLGHLAQNEFEVHPTESEVHSDMSSAASEIRQDVKLEQAREQLVKYLSNDEWNSPEGLTDAINKVLENLPDNDSPALDSTSDADTVSTEPYSPMGISSPISSETTQAPHVIDVEECCACSNDLPVSELVQLRCEHYWCATCLTRTFSMMLTSTVPPQCCKSIPLSEEVLDAMMHTLFGSSLPGRLMDGAPGLWYLVETVLRRSARKHLALDQITCSACGEWVELLDMDKDSHTATCNNHNCRHRACILCKAPAPGRHECPKDPIRLLMEQERENGLSQKCPACGLWAIKTKGCNHIM